MRVELFLDQRISHPQRHYANRRQCDDITRLHDHWHRRCYRGQRRHRDVCYLSGGGVVDCGNGVLWCVTQLDGAATITGTGSRWDADSIGYVGLNGSGSLLIEKWSGSLFNSACVGYSVNSTGAVTVTGAGSEWRQFSLYVGSAGTGTVQVENGGTVNTNWGVRIGDVVGGTGTVTVTGENSTWNAGTGPSDDLYVGGSGTGTLATLPICQGKRHFVRWFGACGVNINSLSTVNIGVGGLAGILDAGEILKTQIANFNHTDAITQLAAISGSGTINKTGAGSTTLSNASSSPARLPPVAGS